jgi:gentisate 1,2-dioxygenase
MLQPHHQPEDDLASLIEAARFYDYRVASNPLADGGVPPVPGVRFSASLHEQGPTQIVPLDSSRALGCPGPATTPSLSANFLHVHSGDALATDANATSQLFYVLRGEGMSRVADAAGTVLPWSAGDLFTLPAGSPATHIAGEEAALYWVHDEPLLRYLGAAATRPRFAATLYRQGAIREALEAVLHDPESRKANRLSVLLGNHRFPREMTVTHVLWAMFGILPVGAVQAPHRHQSVAVDFVVDAQPGCYTMVGARLANDGSIADGERFDWERHSVFVTPPGLWHSHHNESGQPAHVLPIQDAGLHTYLRTLSILFSRSTADGGHQVVDNAS